MSNNKEGFIFITPVGGFVVAVPAGGLVNGVSATELGTTDFLNEATLFQLKDKGTQPLQGAFNDALAANCSKITASQSVIITLGDRRES